MYPDNVAKESDPVLEYDPFAYGDMPFICKRNMDRLTELTARFTFWCNRLAECRAYLVECESGYLAPLCHAYGLVRDGEFDLWQAELEVSDLRSELLYVLLPDYYFVRV